VINVKPVILVFNKYYFPGYRSGGPVRTLANMMAKLGEEFNFKIVSLDRDVGSEKPYEGIEYDRFNTVGNVQVMYLNPRTVTLINLIKIIKAISPDVIYLNSFSDPTFTQRVLLARRLNLLRNIPVVLAPRGEFSKGALNIKKTKKKIYIGASRISGLYRNLIWHVSSVLERQDVNRNFSSVNQANILEAMDLALHEDRIPKVSVTPIPGEPLKVCFLSRITPMKNLDFALRVLANVNAQVVFTIYGPKEDLTYWEECERLIDSLPSNVKVVYGNEVHPTDVQRSLMQHDVYLLPTRGENYGHVIHEALQAGLPVLISDQTPWGNVVERGIGWTLPLDSESDFARVIDEVALWTDEKMLSVRHAAIVYARECSDDPKTLKANRALFWHAMKGAQS
jgi:glycosyltransferase involved in cell wall biosynthesis